MVGIHIKCFQHVLPTKTVAQSPFDKRKDLKTTKNELGGMVSQSVGEH